MSVNYWIHTQVVVLKTASASIWTAFCLIINYTLEIGEPILTYFGIFCY